MALNLDGLPRDAEQFGVYLSELSDDHLLRLESALKEHVTTVKKENESRPPEEGVERLKTLSMQIGMLRAEKNRREEMAAQTAAQAAAEQYKKAMADLEAIVSGKPADAVEAPAENPEVSAAVAGMANVFANAIQQAVERLAPQPAVTASVSSGPSLNRHIRLGDVARRANDPKVAPQRSEAVIVASADLPGRARNGVIEGIKQLAQFMGDRARMLPVTRGNPNYVPVAYLKREFRYRLGLDSTPEEINEVLTAAANTDALVAAGGWCAPSEISYDFFNIVCEDGLIDLPTVGVLNRGGIRFPTSPTIADIFADPDVLWSWTEAQDQAAETNGDVKTCARVICPDFDEVRAACDGLCVTAGNLTDFAYPEAVENYLRLVMAARAHRTNQIIIDQLVNAATAVDMTATDEGATAALLNSVELQATDYRERFRMCEDAVIEVILPRWARGVIRADLANRNGLALYNVTNAMIADWFDIRSIRAQFVADWQSGFTSDPLGQPSVNATQWPDTIQYLLYAPGTFVRGQGLQLDLGVVRDSALNETNDHTAAWMEDCYAIAKVGHEARVVSTAVCTAGVTGAAELSCATTA